MSWGENTFLKDTDTISILPAPQPSRDMGVEWYEVQISRHLPSMKLLAFDKDGKPAGHIECTYEDGEDGSTILNFLFDSGGKKVPGKIIASKNDDGEARIEGVIADSEFAMGKGCALGEDLHIDLEPGQLAPHWQWAIPSLDSFSNALKARSVDSNSWGCASCMSQGIATLIMTAYCGFTRSIPACASAVAMWVAQLENCPQGVCRDDHSG